MTETVGHMSTTPRTVRFLPDTWEVMESRRGMTASVHIRDMTEAGLGFARCYRCAEPVPVEFGDLTGKPLAEWVAEAGKAVTAQHRAGHHPVTIGNATAGKPRGDVLAPRFIPAPGLPPGMEDAAPEVPVHRIAKGRRS